MEYIIYLADYLRQTFGKSENFFYFCAPIRRDARVVEEARLESVYTPKGYPGFESLSLREIVRTKPDDNSKPLMFPAISAFIKITSVMK